MKILSVRKGFRPDHSSTSYEFFAVDKPLGTSERKAVAKLSSRANPTKRQVSFVYHAEGYDLPGGWEPLMKKYYDVMYCESYDWWTLVIAFDTDQKTIKKIQKYDFTGADDLGVDVDSKGDRVIISIHCRLRAEAYGHDDYDSYDEYYDEDEEDDEECDTAESHDRLLNLLTQNREYLKKGDYRLLYGAWKEYGNEAEEDAPPEPSGMKKGPRPIQELLSLLESR